MSSDLRPEELLQGVVEKLSELSYKVVYVGGATTDLYRSDPAASPAGATEDVDIVVDVYHMSEYATTLRKQLIAIGGKEDDSEGAPRCRWIINQIQVDVMAPTAEVLGFSNRWYPQVLCTARPYTLEGGATILIPSAPLFLATKMEAFQDRGRGDFWASKDIEDIVAVLDGRPELVEEILKAPANLRSFIQKRLSTWLQQTDFEQAISAHLQGDLESQGRAEVILETLHHILR